MSSVFLRIALMACVLLAAGCEREQRDYHAAKKANAPPGEHYQLDAFDVAQGKRLYTWMNCVGCHSHGGGGIGVRLDDSEWRYGGKLQQIYSSIRDGRPNGMPAWRARLTDQQMWQLAAYVRSMGRYVPKDVAPSRDDAMQSGKSENRKGRSAPESSTP